MAVAASMRKAVLRVSLVLGIALFALVIAKTGPARLWAEIRLLAWSEIAVLLVLRTVFWVLRTVAWRSILVLYEAPRPFGRLFEARIADHAISYLTPSASLGGEPTRAFMAGGASRRRVFATVVLDKTVEILTLSAFTIAAMAAALAALPMPAAARWTFGTFIVVSALLCAGLLAWQRRGFFMRALGLLPKIGLGLKWLERNRSRIEDIDAGIADYYRLHRRSLPATAGLYGASFLLWVVEIHLTLGFLGASGLTVTKSLLVVTLGNAALLLPTVPASLGIYELTNIGVFSLLGWDAGLAVSVSVVRRLLALFWTAAGLLVLARRQREASPARGGAPENGPDLR